MEGIPRWNETNFPYMIYNNSKPPTNPKKVTEDVYESARLLERANRMQTVLKPSTTMIKRCQASTDFIPASQYKSEESDDEENHVEKNEMMEVSDEEDNLQDSPKLNTTFLANCSTNKNESYDSDSNMFEDDLEIKDNGAIIENIMNLSCSLGNVIQTEFNHNQDKQNEKKLNSFTKENNVLEPANSSKFNQSFSVREMEEINSLLELCKNEDIFTSEIIEKPQKINATKFQSNFLIPKVISKDQDFIQNINENINIKSLQEPPVLSILFKTARGEELPASQQNVKKFKRVFSQILNEFDDPNELILAGKKNRNQCDKEQNINLSQKKSNEIVINKVKKEVTSTVTSNTPLNEPPVLSILFKTARGEELPASQQNVKKFKRVFSQILNEFDDPNELILAGKKNRNQCDKEQNINLSQKKSNEIVINKVKKEVTSTVTSNTPLNEPPVLSILFKTARGEELPASQQNVKKFKRVFSEILNEFDDPNDLILAKKNRIQQDTKKNTSTPLKVIPTNIDLLPLYNDEVDDLLSNMQISQQKVGFLFNKKLNKERQNLLEYVGNRNPKLYSFAELVKFGVSKNIINCTIENAVDFTFHLNQVFMNISEIPKELIIDGKILNYNEKYQLGITEFISSFITSLKKIETNQIISTNWIKTNYKWIIVKLASMERCFPDLFAGKILTPENVLLQLQYRYDCEIINSKHSPLEIIKTKQMDITRSIVLFVSQLTLMNNVYQLKLSDGWKCIWCNLDEPLQGAVKNGKIKIGTKLIISKIFDNINITHLELRANSTRRVKWNTKLGFHRKNLSIKLDTILLNGGRISLLRFFVLRVYPLMCADKIDQNNSVLQRNKLLKQIQVSSTNELKLDNDDPLIDFQYDNSVLSTTNQSVIEEENQVLKLCIIDATLPNRTFQLSIWKPDEFQISILKENNVINANNLIVDKNSKTIKLINGKCTKFRLDLNQDTNVPENYRRKLYFLSSINNLNNFKPFLNQFDTIGMIFSLGPNLTKGRESVYITDINGNILSINFMNKISNFSCKNLIKIKNIIGIKNLEWHAHNTYEIIPTANVTQKTIFYENCDNEYFNEFNEFKQSILSKNSDIIIQNSKKQFELMKKEMIKFYKNKK